MFINTKKEKGYTLIELVVSIALIGIVSTLLASVMVSIMGILKENRVKKELLLDGYNATAKFVREFELITDESDLHIGNSNQILFDTTIDGLVYSIQYQISGNELQRSVGMGLPVTVCSNVSGSFEYYQKNHTQLSAPLSNPQLSIVRRVRLILTMSAGALSYTYTADAFPENYRFSGGGY